VGTQPSASWKTVPFRASWPRWRFGSKRSIPYSKGSDARFMHAKILVADDFVYSGSFTFRTAASRNAENVIQFESAQIATQCAALHRRNRGEVRGRPLTERKTSRSLGFSGSCRCRRIAGGGAPDHCLACSRPPETLLVIGAGRTERGRSRPMTLEIHGSAGWTALARSRVGCPQRPTARAAGASGCGGLLQRRADSGRNQALCRWWWQEARSNQSSSPPGGRCCRAPLSRQ